MFLLDFFYSTAIASTFVGKTKSAGFIEVDEEFPPVVPVLDPEPELDPEPAPEPEAEPEELTDEDELPPPPPPQEAKIRQVVISNNDPNLFIISPNLILIILLNLNFTSIFNAIFNFD